MSGVVGMHLRQSRSGADPAWRQFGAGRCMASEAVLPMEVENRSPK